MDYFVGKRIKELRNHYNLGLKEFATKCGLSHVALFHIEKGKTAKPHIRTLKRITECFGTTTEWLMYGMNEMLPSGNQEIFSEDQKTESSWKNEAFRQLKLRNSELEKEVDRLWKMIDAISFPHAPMRRVIGEG